MEESATKHRESWEEDSRAIWEKVEIEEGTSITKPLRNLCKEYQDIFKDELPMGLPVSRHVDHAITLEKGSIPPRKKLYRLSQKEEDILKEQLQQLIEKGFIVPSSSPYGSLVIFIKKKDRKLRMCVDYRALNTQMIKNAYPLPRIDEMFDRIYAGRVFSSFDLTSGYHQVRIKPDDCEKTAFCTRYGQYQFRVVPFGLCNAPATFQAMMHELFQEHLDAFLVIFLDDMLAYSKNPKDHVEHIRKIFQILRQNKLYLKPHKCKLGVEKLEWLGHVIYNGAIGTCEAKIQAVKEWPTPTKVKEVRGFLGLTGYYWRFVEHFSRKARPLHNLLQDGIQYHWGEEQENTFQTL